MNRKRILDLGVVFVTVGGLLIAVIAVKSNLVELMPSLRDWVFTLCLVLGLVLGVLGVLLLVLLMLPIETAQRVWWWLFGKKNYVPRRAKREDLEDIHAFGCAEFGEVSPLSKMRDWYKINRDIFHVVHSVRRGKLRRYEKLIGYYSVIPLKRAAVPLLDDDNFDGTKITDDLIVKERKGKRSEQPACIYIGGIAAKGSKYAQGVVMGGLFSRLEVENDRGISLFYSRPVTDRGLELLREHRFEPVKSPNDEPLKHIYKYNFSSDSDVHEDAAPDD